MKRPYQLKQRGEARDQTRQKIVEAAIRLHQAKGIAATSMSDIAELAGVGKVTVYRHFPDLGAVAGACSGLYFERNPFPDPEQWRLIDDADDRLRQGLKDAYAWHRSTEPMMSSVYAEARALPVMQPYLDYWAAAAEVLLEAWQEKGRRKVLLRAAIALALDIETWRTLTQVQGLKDAQAVELMMRLTCDCLPGRD